MSTQRCSQRSPKVSKHFPTHPSFGGRPRDNFQAEAMDGASMAVHPDFSLLEAPHSTCRGSPGHFQCFCRAMEQGQGPFQHPRALNRWIFFCGFIQDFPQLQLLHLHPPILHSCLSIPELLSDCSQLLRNISLPTQRSPSGHNPC